MLKQACPEEILNQVQNDTFRVHDKRVQQCHSEPCPETSSGSQRIQGQGLQFRNLNTHLLIAFVFAAICNFKSEMVC